MNTNRTAAIAATVWSTEDTNRTATVVPMPQYMRPTEGMFLVEWRTTGCVAFARFTGRTRRFWGVACPTVELFDVDTVADEAGAVWGAPGARRAGTWAVRPERVVAAA